LPPPHHHTLFFFLLLLLCWWYWGLNSGPCVIYYLSQAPAPCPFSCFRYILNRALCLCLSQPVLYCDPPIYAPCVAGMIGHHTKLLVEMGSLDLFCLDSPWTVILLIFASPVARITGVSLCVLLPSLLEPWMLMVWFPLFAIWKIILASLHVHYLHGWEMRTIFSSVSHLVTCE
jgi:hypothetical protein